MVLGSLAFHVSYYMMLMPSHLKKRRDFLQSPWSGLVRESPLPVSPPRDPNKASVKLRCLGSEQIGYWIHLASSSSR